MQDLDLRKPGVWKPAKRHEFEVTTKEALRKADFRVSVSVFKTPSYMMACKCITECLSFFQM